MYKSGVEKFMVGNNIHLSVICEATEGENHYVFMKISLFGKDTYAICALGDGYSLEVIGEDEHNSREFFKTVLKQNPSPCHLFDIVSDFRHEEEYK